MEKNITKRLAAQNLSTAQVSAPWLFKIVETVLGSKIVSVSSHVSPGGKQFCAIIFESAADAKKIYDYCDGVHIEDTNEYFDLSFIPDGVDIGSPIEICEDSKTFRYTKAVSSHEAVDYANMIELSDEGDETPEDPNDDLVPPAVERKNPAREREAAKVEEVTEALKQPDPNDELSGFVFDVKDSRFETVFTDRDFTVDASHRKFNRQSGMVEVLDEVRRRYDETEDG